jgi:hypothetical protein
VSVYKDGRPGSLKFSGPNSTAAADLLKPEYHGRVAYHCLYYSWDPICLGGVQLEVEILTMVVSKRLTCHSAYLPEEE